MPKLILLNFKPSLRVNNFEGDKFVSIKVAKGGMSKGGAHEVDGISGGTLTSNGLDAMIRSSLSPYQLYFQKNKKN